MEGLTWLDNIIAKLHIRLGSIGIMNQFCSNEDYATLFNNIWKLEQYIELPEVPVQKNNAEAKRLRNLGNEIFKLKDYSLAKTIYNQSIQKCTFDGIVSMEKCLAVFETFEGLNTINVRRYYNFWILSFGYANRSAANYYLQYYKECVLDINRAIFFGYPDVLKPKLIERLVKCFVAMDKKQRAIQSLKNYLSDNVVIAECPEEKKILLQELLAKCESGEEILSKEGANKKLKYFRIPTAPDLKNVNPNIPVLSDGVTIGHVQGNRRLIAARDIIPGEVLGKENSRCTYIYNENLKDYCFSCTVEALDPVPCPFCSRVVFCGEKCLLDAMKSFHYFECSLFSILSLTSYGEFASPLLRFIASFSLEDLERQFQNVKEIKKSLCTEPNYFSSHPEMLYYHITRKHLRNSGDLFLCSVIAAVIVKSLKEKNYFKNVENSPESLSKYIKLVGQIALRHDMSFDKNMSEIIVQKGQKDYDVYNFSSSPTIGKDLQGALSLAKYSCYSNTEWLSFGNTKVLVSFSFIPKGTEITRRLTSCYRYAKFHRNIHIKEWFYVECSCIACLENWPEFDDLLNSKIYFQCSLCTAEIELNSLHCPRCKISASLLKVSQGNEEFSTMEVLFRNVTESIGLIKETIKLNYRVVTEVDFERVKRCVYLLSRYSIPPSSLLHTLRKVSSEYLQFKTCREVWE